MVHKAKTNSEQSLALPLSVVSPSDVGRLLRELESIDNLISQSIINSHDAGPKIPKTSLLMEQTIELSKLDLLKADDRKQHGKGQAEFERHKPRARHLIRDHMVGRAAGKDGGQGGRLAQGRRRRPRRRRQRRLRHPRQRNRW